ncbi:putative nuclease HARBI1 [Merluccius polli]|uniref:Nuclease HARBI1 n=1 Tax=Merluccius polli TaxID=89951 RepID=A0AA47MH99_MERPO|nr:putative nuclease HARBI1 [Merluccius polli]
MDGVSKCSSCSSGILTNVDVNISYIPRRDVVDPRAQHGEEPGVVCAHTGADHAGVAGNRGIPAGAGRSVRSVPVNTEPSHASCVGRNHPNIIQLTNIVARWPGSTHDSFIMTNSMVGNRLEAGTVRNGWLLGDCGYPLRTWLMTPLADPNTDQERRYNDLHSRTRAVVERAIGLLKGRWRCLDRSGCAAVPT